jgi:hypothetical protein
MKRIVYLALVALSLFLAGCATPVPVRVQGVHVGHNNAVAYNVAGVIPAAQPLRTSEYAVVGQSSYGRSVIVYQGARYEVYPHQQGFGHCNAGWRMLPNGGWLCMDPNRRYHGEVVVVRERPQILDHQVVESGGSVRCLVRSGVNGSEIRKVINVATPADCEAVGEIVDEAKQQVAGRAPRKGPKPATRSEAGNQEEAERHVCKSQTAEWAKLNWPGHPQHEKFVCMEPGDSHRF